MLLESQDKAGGNQFWQMCTPISVKGRTRQKLSTDKYHAKKFHRDIMQYVIE